MSAVTGIVVVVYRSMDTTVEFVRRELSKVTCPHKTVVVDVGTTPEHSERLAGALGIDVWQDGAPVTGDLFLLSVPENLGYARGNNRGAVFLSRLFPDIDRFLFSNDDIELLSPNVLEVLSDTLDTHPEIGCVGPYVVDLQGHLQPPQTEPTRITGHILNNLLEPVLGRQRLRRRRILSPPSRGPVRIVSGCFHLVRRSAFDAIGGFDERTFLYWEEEILSRRLERIGQGVYFESGVTVCHHVGETMKRTAPNLLLLRCMLDGQQLYFRHYTRSSRAALALLTLSAWFRTALVRLALWKHALLNRTP